MIASALLLPLLLEGVAAFAPVPHAPSSIHRSAATTLSQMFSEESAALEVVDDEGGNAADPFDIYRASDAQKEIAIKDIKTGSGYTVGETDNQLLQIQFTAKFVEGQTKFSPTIKEFDVPSMVFKTGEERCLPGLEEGIQGMKVGGTRCVKVPPNKGYGDKWYRGVVPPNSHLEFETTLMKIAESPGEEFMMKLEQFGIGRAVGASLCLGYMMFGPLIQQKLASL